MEGVGEGGGDGDDGGDAILRNRHSFSVCFLQVKKANDQERRKYRILQRHGPVNLFLFREIGVRYEKGEFM